MKSGSNNNNGSSAPASPASQSTAAVAATAAAADVRALATVGSAAPSSKKKVLDLLPSGTSLALRLKKQEAPFTPSPSEFRARERQDLTGKWFLFFLFQSFQGPKRGLRCLLLAGCRSSVSNEGGSTFSSRSCRRDLPYVEYPTHLRSLLR